MTAAANSLRTSALVALVYLRKHDILARTADGFGISVGTAHAYTSRVISLPADRAPGLLKVLRTHDPDSTDDYSHKHRRHGVNVQVVADPTGKVLWISPALPGRCHDQTAARTHRIIRICTRQGVPILADRAYQGVGPWVTISNDVNRQGRPHPGAAPLKGSLRCATPSTRPCGT